MKNLNFIKKKVFNKITSVIVATMMCSAIVVNPNSLAEAQSDVSDVLLQASQVLNVASTSTRYTRRFNQWSYKSTDNELYEAGCGLFSTGNAIYAMTGQTINIAELKSWAKSVKGWTATEGLYRHAYFSNLKNSSFAKQYGFTVTGPTDGGITSNNKIIATQLKKGNVAVVIGVPGHYMTITDYDETSNKYFVIEGAVSSSAYRGLDAASWVSESKLSTGNTKVKSYTFLTFNNIKPTIYESMPAEKIFLKNKSTGTYMTVDGNTATNGQNVSVASKTSLNAFKFNLSGGTNNYITSEINQSFVVNPYSDNPGNNTNITLYKQTDKTQIFKFEAVSGGYVIHSGYDENCVLTVDGTNVKLATKNENDNKQIWIVEKVGAETTTTTTTTSTTTTSTTTTTTTTATKVIPMNQFKGSGTLNDPYQISSKAELKKLSEFVNDHDYCSHYAHAHYIQTADIDLENEEWTPIGIGSINDTFTYENMFHGSYNGNQHYISNLKISQNNIVTGLFGYTDGEYTENRGYIHDLVVTGNINSPQSMNAGGIVGRTISGSVIENCGFIGNVSGGGNSSAWSGAGGIVGCFYASGAIRNCYHTGNVTSDTRAGGIAGMIRFYDKNENLTAEVTRCFHAVGKISGGTMDGGITGECVLYGTGNEVLVTDCYVASDSGTDIKLLNTALNSTQMKTIAEMQKLGDVLGNPFVNNPETSLFSLNSGCPIFFWQIQEITGDINSDGKVSINDAVLLQEYLLGKEQLTEEQYEKADINSDGSTDIFDMVLMRKLIT